MQDKRYAPRVKPPRKKVTPHPNQLAALATHRRGWPGKRCKCGLIALKGMEVCYRHAGRARQGSKVVPAREAQREVNRARAAGLIPPGLLAMDVFVRCMMGRLGLALAARALMQAWDNRDNDPAAWVAAVRQARNQLEM